MPAACLFPQLLLVGNGTCTRDERSAEEAAAAPGCPVAHHLARPSLHSPSPQNRFGKVSSDCPPRPRPQVHFPSLTWTVPPHSWPGTSLDAMKQLRGVTTQALPFPEPLKYSRCRPSHSPASTAFFGSHACPEGSLAPLRTLLLPPPQDQIHQPSTSATFSQTVSYWFLPLLGLLINVSY